MAAVTSWQRELVDLINALRSEEGVAPLTIDASLHEAAGWRAHDMLSRNYFAYDTPPVGPRQPARPEGPPSAVIQRFGYVPASDGWTSEESILIGDLDGDGTVSAGDVFATWRNSPAHLRNMISKDFQAIGVGGPAEDGPEHPMAGVCVLEFGSEVVAPVGEPAHPTFLLPRAAPPVPTPQAPLDEHDRIAIGTVSGRDPGPTLHRMPAGAKTGCAGMADAVSNAGPTGPIMTPAPWGSFNTDWSAINQWNDILTVAANEFGVPFARLKGHVVIESQGDPTAVQRNDNNGWSYGLMQIVPFGVGWDGWHADVLRLAGYNGNPAEMLVNDPGLNVRVGAYILAMQKDNYGSWDKASSSFFVGNPDWDTSDEMNMGRRYMECLRGLMEEMTSNDGTNTGTETLSPATATGAALVACARERLGAPYVWATAGPSTFDAPGLVYYCYKQVTGEDLDFSYRDSHKQFLWGDPVDPNQSRPGDLVFYDTYAGTEVRLGNTASHVGIYAGGNELISALNPDVGVVNSDISGSIWENLWIGTRRVLPPG